MDCLSHAICVVLMLPYIVGFEFVDPLLNKIATSPCPVLADRYSTCFKLYLLRMSGLMKIEHWLEMC